MPTKQDKPESQRDESRRLEALLAAAAAAGGGIAFALRKRLARLLSGGWKGQDTDIGTMLTSSKAELERAIPQLAAVLTEHELQAAIRAVESLASRAPTGILAEIAKRPSPPKHEVAAVAQANPRIRRAVESLLSKKLVTPQQFRAMSDSAKAKAFTVASNTSTETIGRIRNLLVESFQDNRGKQFFREKVAAELDSSFLGDWHVDLVHRQQVQDAYYEQQEQQRQDPVFGSLYPFALYRAKSDGAVRDNHLALEHFGLNNTAVYWSDDPMWELFRPPWEWNCRCRRRLLTVSEAAKYGVQVAAEWDATGSEPTHREYRLDVIPFRPDPDYRRGT